LPSFLLYDSDTKTFDFNPEAEEGTYELKVFPKEVTTQLEDENLAYFFTLTVTPVNH